MITANQILKKLQDKIWGKNTDMAHAAANSILAHGMTYNEFLSGSVEAAKEQSIKSVKDPYPDAVVPKKPKKRVYKKKVSTSEE